MTTVKIRSALVILVGCVVLSIPALAQSPASAHIDAAKTLAGDDVWLQGPFNCYCVAGNARPNNASAPALEPVRLFDNLYAVGKRDRGLPLSLSCCPSASA